MNKESGRNDARQPKGSSRVKMQPESVEKALRILLLGFAFSLPLSIALAELFAYLSMALWIVRLALGRETDGSIPRARPLRNPYLVPVVLFAGVALFVSILGVRPKVSLDKIHRLFLLALIFILPAVYARDGRGVSLIYAFLTGCACLGLLDLVRVPLEMARGVSLYDTGNMRDPQMYLVALCFLFSAWLSQPGTIPRIRLAAATALAALGMTLHFKRGSWFSCFAAMGLACLFAGRWKWLLYLVLTACALTLVPQARDRLDMLRNEWSPRQGGRFVLWTRVAPVLIAEHPRGMGYAATEAEDFQRFKTVQPHLNHLHNNILQITLELGLAGLAVWLGWMLLALGMLAARYRDALRAGDADAWARLGALTAFCGLMINGTVEYNFGDSEILMLLSFLMGLSCLKRSAPTPA